MSAADLTDPTPREWAVIAYLCGDNKELAPNIQKQVTDLLTFKGASHLYVAAQWDLPEGGERAVLTDAGSWEREPIAAVNTGDPEALLTFLRWAFDRCPSERVLFVASGTGLLDPRASVGGPGHDRQLFTICNDSTSGDALSLSELRRLFRRAVEISNRDQIDIVALDMRELQCLEVAYELEDAVSVLIAPQTRIPDSGWNFGAVLKAMDAAIAGASAGAAPLSVQDMARIIVRTVGVSYDLTHHGDLSLSALDLRALNPVASAFDTLSLAMVHSVGEELVWKARCAVAHRLKPPQPPPDDATDRIGMSDADIQLSVEREYLYDLPEMLTELAKEMQQHAETGMVDLIVGHFAQLDPDTVARTLESIDTACFISGSRLRLAALQASIGDPKGTRRRLRNVMKRVRSHAASVQAESARSAELYSLFTNAESRVGTNRSWIDDWPDEVIAALDPDLANTYRVALRQQQRLFHLSALTTRVLSLLKSGSTPDANTARIVPLILEHFVGPDPARAARHGGVSLFRPQDLDRLIASDYLDLRFNRKIHWTVLLAVINLIDKHPRALWRILSAVLATADNTTRAQLIDRIAGPGSVIAPFRDQFVVLAPVKAFVLSLEPDPNATLPAPLVQKRGGEAQGRGPQAYRVRLELAEREAFISEVSSIVDPDALADVVTRLVALLKTQGGVTEADVKQLDALGDTLGEDILQDLGIVLAANADSSRKGIHVQLQIPRELMRYPWELMHHKGGWLSEDFAVGRQVFSRTGSGSVRSRVPGSLRALVIGNPKSDERPLAYAAAEASRIALAFEALSSETDGLIDFNRARDTRINQVVTRYDLRQMLRDGNYDIVHFAGHAAFDAQRPESSAWLLSDGPFSAQSIRNTLRWRETQPWLVFANACEAGMADQPPQMYQTDVFGIASAFLDHGVNVFIGPLWRIDDNVAAETALLFYQQLLKERQTVGEALRRAKVAAKARYFDPVLEPTSAARASEERVALISWAGLVLYGNSTATIGQRVGAPAPVAPPNPEGPDDDV